MSTTIIKSYEFTKLATKGLTDVQEDAQLIEQLRKGDSKTWKMIFKNFSENNYTFGVFLKRYISQKQHLDYDTLSDKILQLKIRNLFFNNQMDGIGTLKPGGLTTLTQCLKKCIDRPVTSIKRPTCFLFFFGLGMDEKEASDMLKKEFHQADFNVRDYKEMIYYYCLKHKQKYPEMLHWLEKYDKLQIESSNYIDSVHLKKLFEPIKESNKREDAKFLRYLITLKSLSDCYVRTAQHHTHFNPVSTKENIYKIILSDLEAVLSENRKALRIKRIENITLSINIASNERRTNSVNPKVLCQRLDDFYTGHIVIPEDIKSLLENKFIVLPEFTKDTIKHRLHNGTSNIQREDLLLAILLFCACKYRNPEKSLTESFQKRRNDFEELANYYLTQCGYHELYLLNPLELFFVSCLFYEKPLEFILAVLRYSKTL